MKQLIYKIIAIASVLLSGLGPQVASGQASLDPVAVDPRIEQSDFVLQLSQPVQSRQVITVTNLVTESAMCSTSADDVSLLLWQGCDSIILTEFNYDVTVGLQSAPPDLPQLAVVPTSDSVSNTPVLSSGPTGAEAGVLPGFGTKTSIFLADEWGLSRKLALSTRGQQIYIPTNSGLLPMRC